MPTVHFVSPVGEFTAEVSPGTTLLEAAESCGAPVGHSCGGACACSTCHVWVEEGLLSLTEVQEAEMDRLDQAFDVRPQSRLACQAGVGEKPLQVRVTEESLQAYWDEYPARRPSPKR